MRYVVLICLSLGACEETAPNQPKASIVNGEVVTPVALDPNRPQPPPPTASDTSRSQERSPR
jgi:hypothetical protein